MSYNEEIIILNREVSALAASVVIEDAYWINDPENRHSCEEWCFECGEKRVSELRTENPSQADDIFLDGGWRTEHDNNIACHDCGCILDGSLTDYGAEEELRYFLDDGDFFAYDDNDAYYVMQMLDNFEYTSERRQHLVPNAEKVAKRFLSGRQFTHVLQPGVWADDGGRTYD